MSFITPVLGIATLVASLALLAYVPGAEAISTEGTDAVLRFLAIFGSGCPISGLFAIGLTCGFVGGLFQIYNHHRYQHQ